MVNGMPNVVQEGHRMRSAPVDGPVQALMQGAAPGDLLIQVVTTRVGVVVKACSEADRFHVTPADSKVQEIWTDPLRLIKLNRPA
jgi:hypothetical protein